MCRIISGFIKYLRNIRRYSNNTIVAYRSDILQFKSVFPKSILEAKSVDIKHYLTYLKATKLSLTSINRKLESLKAFYRYCSTNSVITKSPCSTIHQIKATPSETTYLSKDKLLPVLNNIEVGENRQKIRDVLILELLYFTGCRISELINIKKKDVDYQAKRIKVIGKGRTERFIHINSTIVQLIDKYKKVTRNRSGYLFANNKGRKLYSMFLWRLVKRYFPTEVFGEIISPHIIRHTAATHLYQNGASMKSVKDFLGHHSYRSTNSYVHFDHETLMTIFNRCHPKGSNAQKMKKTLMNGGQST